MRTLSCWLQARCSFSADTFCSSAVIAEAAALALAKQAKTPSLAVSTMRPPCSGRHSEIRSMCSCWSCRPASSQKRAKYAVEPTTSLNAKRRADLEAPRQLVRQQRLQPDDLGHRQAGRVDVHRWLTVPCHRVPHAGT